MKLDFFNKKSTEVVFVGMNHVIGWTQVKLTITKVESM
jgi:hypothetical protein